MIEFTTNHICSFNIHVDMNQFLKNRLSHYCYTSGHGDCEIHSTVERQEKDSDAVQKCRKEQKKRSRMAQKELIDYSDDWNEWVGVPEVNTVARVGVWKLCEGEVGVLDR